MSRGYVVPEETCPACKGSGEASFYMQFSEPTLWRTFCPACDGAGYIEPEEIDDDE